MRKSFRDLVMAKAKRKISGGKFVLPVSAALRKQRLIVERWKLQTKKMRDIAEVVIAEADLDAMATRLTTAQQAELKAARARVEAAFRRDDMSTAAVRRRAQAGAEWEREHGPVAVFAGTRRETRR